MDAHIHRKIPTKFNGKLTNPEFGTNSKNKLWNYLVSMKDLNEYIFVEVSLNPNKTLRNIFSKNLYV